MATTPRSGGPARSRPAAQSSRHSCCAQARSSLRRKRPQKAPSRHQISTPPAFNPTEPDRDYRGKPPTHAEGENHVGRRTKLRPDERYQSTLANDAQVRLGRRRPLKYSASASPSAVAGGSPYRYSVAIAPQSAP